MVTIYFFVALILEDRKTMFLNAILIFFVMVFAYPLKFLTTFLVDFFTGNFATSKDISAVLTLEQAPWLTVIYSLGYGAMFFVFALLYRHAYKRRDDIGLSQAEAIMTKTAMHSNYVHVVFAVIVSLLALMLPKGWNLGAGGFFVLVGIPLAIVGNRGAKHAEKALQEKIK